MFNRLAMNSLLSAMALVFSCSLTSWGDETFTLANGLRVRLVPERDPGNVCVVLAVRAGIVQEGKQESHLAHVTEHATVYDLAEAGLAETVKRWFGQGKANAETLGELMYFDLHCKRDELPTGLAIQAARLAKMNYSAATLEREIPRALAEFEHLSRQPGGMGKFALIPFVQAALYGETKVPIRRQTKQIGVQEVRVFHDRSFRVPSATLVVVGDFDATKARQEIEQRLGTLAQNKTATSTRPVLMPGKHRVQWDVPKRHAFVAWRIPEVSASDYPAVWLVGRLLQNRLFDSAARAGAGQFQVYTDLDQMLVIGCEVQDEPSFDAAHRAVMSELERLRQPGGIDRAALRLGCDQLERFQKTNLDEVPLPQGMTRAMARANLELQRLVVQTLVGDWEQFLTKLRAVSSRSAEAAVGKWLSPERACFVEVVPEGGE
ncbi:MAG TPA: insulinase family protein [Pirellulales bacterium]|nr:insulinase family protein [Pirellulales bacterium]